jgi:hypothetical protein
MLDDDCQGDVGDGSGSSANKGVRCFPNVVMIIIRQRQFIGATSSRLTLHFRSCSSRGRRVKEIGNSFGRLMGRFFFGLCGCGLCISQSSSLILVVFVGGAKSPMQWETEPAGASMLGLSLSTLLLLGGEKRPMSASALLGSNITQHSVTVPCIRGSESPPRLD